MIPVCPIAVDGEFIFLNKGIADNFLQRQVTIFLFVISK